MASEEQIKEDDPAGDAPRVSARREPGLVSLAELALGGTELEVLFDQAAIIVGEGLAAELVGVFEYLPDERVVLLRAGTGWPDGWVGERRLDAGEGTQSAFVLAGGRPIRMPELRSEKRFVPAESLAELGIESGAAVRIGERRNPFGFLGVHFTSHREMGDDDVELLEAASVVLAMAIDRSRLERRLAAHQSAVSVLAEADDLDEAAPLLLRTICEGIGWELGVLWVVDPDGGVLRAIDVWSSPLIDSDRFEELTLGSTFAPGEWMPGRAWESGEPLWVTDVGEDVRFRRVRKARMTALQTALFVPITRAGGVLGVLEFLTRDTYQPDEQLMADLGTVGTQVGQFIARELAREETRRSRDQLDAILRNVGAAVVAQDPDGKLLFANEAARTFGLDGIETLTAAGAEETAGGLEILDEEGRAVPPEQRPGARAIATAADQPATVLRIRGWAEGDGSFIVRSTPVLDAEGQPEAVITVLDEITDLKRVEMELRESEHRHRSIALTLQRSLLPPDLPALPGLRVASRFLPAHGGTIIGGDFYDVFRTGPSTWMLVVGDVAGKGAEAAAITALTRYTVRAAAVIDTTDPSAVLDNLNQSVLRQTAGDRFCTAVCATVEVDGSIELCVARGGHPPPLLRKGARVRRMELDGPLIGAFADAEFDQEAFALEPGDALVLYTDGVSEAGARLDGERALEIEGVAEIVEAAGPGTDADVVAGEIESAVLRREGGTPRDDVAILVLSVPPG